MAFPLFRSLCLTSSSQGIQRSLPSRDRRPAALSERRSAPVTSSNQLGASQPHPLNWHTPRYKAHVGAKLLSSATTRVVAAALQEDVLVSTRWLADSLQDVSILDVRGRVDTVLVEPGVEKSSYLDGYDEYLEGHIPGASFFSWTRNGVDPSDPVPVQLQTNSDVFAAEMESKGVGTGRPVVIYDHGDHMMAARLWWCLVYHGHPQPLILEGGWQKWVEEGRATQLYEPCPLKVQADFEADPRPGVRMTAGDVMSALADEGDGEELVLIDARTQDQYNGKVRRALRGGRIPTAISVPRKALLDANGGLLPLEQQRATLEAAGVDFSGTKRQRVVAYCNGGVASCTVALALHRLGVSDWASYDGSWNEWGNRQDLPVEGGDT